MTKSVISEKARKTNRVHFVCSDCAKKVMKWGLIDALAGTVDKHVDDEGKFLAKNYRKFLDALDQTFNEFFERNKFEVACDRATYRSIVEEIVEGE